MPNTILKEPTITYRRGSRGAGGKIGGLFRYQNTQMIKAVAGAGTLSFNSVFCMDPFVEGGNIYRVGMFISKHGDLKTEDWNATGVVTLTNVALDRWRPAGASLTTISSKGDWIGAATTPTSLLALTSLSAGFGTTMDNVDGYGYWEVSRENAPALILVQPVLQGDFIRYHTLITNSSATTINVALNMFIDVERTSA